MRKILRLLPLLFLLSVSFTLASEPQFDMIVTLNNSINPQNQSIGNIIIKKLSYLPDNYVFSDMTNMTLQKYDRLTNNLTNSFMYEQDGNYIGILVPQESIIIDRVGVIKFIMNTNTSNYFFVTSQPEDSQTITISTSVEGEGITLSPTINNFNLLDEKIVGFIVDVDEDISPDEYDYSIYFSNTFNNKSINNTFTLNEVKKFIVTSQNYNHSIAMKAGSTMPLGSVVLSNAGNTNFQIYSNISGTAKEFIILQSEQTLFKKSFAVFNINAAVPSLTADGVYSAKIVFFGGQNKHEIDINLTIKDTTPPVLSNLNFSEDVVFRDNLITIKAEDNLAVDRVTMKVNDVLYNLTRDENIFKITQSFNSTAMHYFEFCAYDAGNNSMCLNESRMFSRLDAIQYTPRMTAPTKKFSTFSKTILLNISETIPYPINITLEDFVANLDEGYMDKFVFRIVDAKGEEKRFESINSTVSVVDKGFIYFEVRSDVSAEWEALFRIDTGDLLNSVPKLVVVGKHSNYELTPSFTKSWINGQLECEPIDTGDLETSQLKCITYHPATSEFEKLTLPMSVEEYDLFVEQTNSTISDANKKTMTMTGITVGVLGLFCLSLLFMFFVVKIDPILRVRQR